jgi:hypothetical protein
VHWNELRIAFGNFEGVILVLAATAETSVKLIESYLIKIYEVLVAVYGDLDKITIIPEKVAEFSRQLELMIRVSATKEDLAKLDYSVEERYGVTPASEEVNRRNTLYSEQAAKLLDQFALEMLDGSITRFRLFLTAAVRLKDSIHYNVIVDFSPYPHPPEFEFPQELHNILGDAGEALETMRNWDPISPPEWTEVVQELEDKIYKSETHLIEPIIEEPASPKKGKGFAKSLQMPMKKQPRGIPYPLDQPKAPKGIQLPKKPPKTQAQAESKKAIPFQATIPSESEKKKAKAKEKVVSCPDCGFIYTSKDESRCPLCGSARPK